MNLKNIKNNLTIYFSIFVLTVALIFSNFIGLFSNKSIISNAAEIDMTSYITNSNFSSVNTNVTPATPYNWEKVDGTSTSKDNIVSGVFNRYTANSKTDENYLSDYKLTSLPDSATHTPSNDESHADHKSLMINSYLGAGNSGYRTTSSFSFDQNNFYQLSVTVLTTEMITNNDAYADNYDSRASFYLVDSENDNDVIASYETIDTDNTWLTYNLYISSSNFESKSLALELWLGSKTAPSVGPVFFNKVNLKEISKDLYLKMTDDSTIDRSQSKVINLNEHAVYLDSIDNPTFNDDWNNGWTNNSNSNNSIIAVVNGKSGSTITQYDPSLTALDFPDTNNNSIDDSHVLFMSNTKANFTSVQSNDILIKQHGLYLISVWAWSNCGSNGTPNISLIDLSEQNTLETVNQTVSTSSNKTSDTINNGWKEYTFCVKGHTSKDMNVALQLNLGKQDAMSKGYVYYDDITMQSISFEQFEKNSNNVLDFASEQTPYTINNYSFDYTNNQDNLISYPLKPAAWTQTISEQNNAVSGIVDLRDQKWNEQFALDNYSIGGVNAVRPSNKIDDNNNALLMLSNSSSNKITYKSSDFTLDSSNHAYVISVKISASSLSGQGAQLTIFNSNGTIYSNTNITSSDYKTFKFYVVPDSQSLNYNIELTLNGTGYAIVDDVKIESTTLNTFNSITSIDSPNMSVSKMDLSFDSFEYINIDNLNKNNNKFSTSFWSTVVDDKNTTSYVTNLSTNSVANHSIPAKDGNNALVISSNIPAYYAMKNTQKYNFESSSFYKLSVWVYTIDVKGQNADSKMGATINLVGEDMDNSFEYIDTTYNGNSNEWREYIFYIDAKQASSADLQIGLGSEDNLTSGHVLFDNIKLTKFEDEQSFLDASSDATQNKQLITLNMTDDSDNNDEVVDDQEKTPFNWFIVPSLLTALAIFIALIGSLVRKIKFTRKTKVKNKYDRAITIEKDMDRKERIQLRKTHITELEQQLSDIDLEIEQYIKQFNLDKQTLTEQFETQNKDILDKKNEIVKQKETALLERNKKLAVDKKSVTEQQEVEFRKYIAKLDLEDKKQTKLLEKRQLNLVDLEKKHNERMLKFIERQNFIKAEIQRIDAEIEEIAKEDAAIWEEYKQAKLDAKKRKQEYMDSLKAEKKAKKSTKKTIRTNKY